MEDEEKTFVGQLASTPDDNTLKLVYADWLDEHEQHTKAKFLRSFVETTNKDPAWVNLVIGKLTNEHYKRILREILIPEKTSVFKLPENITQATLITNCLHEICLACNGVMLHAKARISPETEIQLIAIGQSIEDARKKYTDYCTTHHYSMEDYQ